jgi:hypothetical protein
MDCPYHERYHTENKTICKLLYERAICSTDELFGHTYAAVLLRAACGGMTDALSRHLYTTVLLCCCGGMTDELFRHF